MGTYEEFRIKLTRLVQERTWKISESIERSTAKADVVLKLEQELNIWQSLGSGFLALLDQCHQQDLPFALFAGKLLQLLITTQEASAENLITAEQMNDISNLIKENMMMQVLNEFKSLLTV